MTQPDNLPPGCAGAIVSAVCQAFRVPAEDLLGKRRFNPIVRARHAAAWLLLHRPPVGLGRKRSLNEVARTLNINDHSSVINAVRNAEVIARREPRYADLLDRLSKIDAGPNAVIDWPREAIDVPVREAESRALAAERHQLRLSRALAAPRRAGPVAEDDLCAINRASGSIRLLAALEREGLAACAG